ncbi:hypothetical protein ACWEOE_41890 [Amycolatopsis sp. NPDC004368]
MRDTRKAEIAKTSEAVARSMFTPAAMYWGVDREVHARLPETIRHHAEGLLPALARAAVAEATPDLAEVQASVELALRNTCGRRSTTSWKPRRPACCPNSLPVRCAKRRPTSRVCARNWSRRPRRR